MLAPGDKSRSSLLFIDDMCLLSFSTAGIYMHKLSESESEMFLFDPYQKYVQSNNETILDQGTPTKTSLVANIRAAYYIINNYFFISQAKNT